MLKHSRSKHKATSEIVAALGLLAIAVVAGIIAYHLITKYSTIAVKPAKTVEVSYAKLILITDKETDYLTGKTYYVYRAELGILNTGSEIDCSICVLTGYVSDTTVTQTVIQNTCRNLSLKPGYDTYGFIIKIEATDECDANTCPIVQNWFFVLYDIEGRPVATAKPTFVIP